MKTTINTTDSVTIGKKAEALKLKLKGKTPKEKEEIINETRNDGTDARN
jgi:hypothetical protein